MRVALFSTKPYGRDFPHEANAAHGHDPTFPEERLSLVTVSPSAGADAVCACANDGLSSQAPEGLARLGVRYVMSRSAGFNHVDLDLVSADLLAE
ncbi:lactate dehydrogenase-like 2-hydroxyacid dehydrogenase [Dietzia sp. 2505]